LSLFLSLFLVIFRSYGACRCCFCHEYFAPTELVVVFVINGSLLWSLFWSLFLVINVTLLRSLFLLLFLDINISLLWSLFIYLLLDVFLASSPSLKIINFVAVSTKVSPLRGLFLSLLLSLLLIFYTLLGLFIHVIQGYNGKKFMQNHGRAQRQSC